MESTAWAFSEASVVAQCVLGCGCARNCQYQEFPLQVVTNNKTLMNMWGSGTPFSPEGPGGEATAGSYVGDSADEALPDVLPLSVVEKLGGEVVGVPHGPSDEADGLAANSGCPASGNSGNGASSQGDNSNVDDGTDDSVKRMTVQRNDLIRLSTRRLKAVEGEEQPLKDWLLPGYDVYIISLQETLSQSWTCHLSGCV